MASIDRHQSRGRAGPPLALLGLGVRLRAPVALEPELLGVDDESLVLLDDRGLVVGEVDELARLVLASVRHDSLLFGLSRL